MSKDCIQSPITTPPWSVIDLSYSTRHSYAKIVAMCNHVRYVVHITDRALTALPALHAKFLLFLDAVDNNHEPSGPATADFYTWALAPLLPILANDAAELRPPSNPITLRDFLYAPIVEYSLWVESNKLVLHPQDEAPDTRFMFGAALPPTPCAAWPRFLPLDILLPDRSSSVPQHVRLPDGTRAFFQLLRHGHDALLRSTLLAHERIRAAPQQIRVPRLLGLVHSGSDANVVFGLLFAHLGGGAQALTRALAAGATERLRRRWSEQVMRAVHGLHQDGLVWGDARPENVVVDEGENAWLVGLGGGYSPEWVPPEQAGTMDGDLVALKRIVDYIEGEFSMESWQ